LYFIVGNNLPFKTQFESLEAAREWGFKVPKEAKLASNLEEVFDLLNIGISTDMIYLMKQME
jgi:DNA ligase (NAD+)